MSFVVVVCLGGKMSTVWRLPMELKTHSYVLSQTLPLIKMNYNLVFSIFIAFLAFAKCLVVFDMYKHNKRGKHTKYTFL